MRRRRGSNVSVPQPATVPAPATWAMMLVGIGAVGYSMRFAQGKRRAPRATA
ncbi:MAG: PEPxxWA-CTERM sorting domain-containing protein [Sphingomicrobium sp.]